MKGNIPWNKNKSYEENYGDRANEVKRKMVETRRKNNTYNKWSEEQKIVRGKLISQGKFKANQLKRITNYDNWICSLNWE